MVGWKALNMAFSAYRIFKSPTGPREPFKVRAARTWTQTHGPFYGSYWLRRLEPKEPSAMLDPVDDDNISAAIKDAEMDFMLKQNSFIIPVVEIEEEEDSDMAQLDGLFSEDIDFGI